MSFTILLIVLIFSFMILYFTASHDKIIKELQEIRTKCIKINNLKNNLTVNSEVESEDEIETFLNNNKFYNS